MLSCSWKFLLFLSYPKKFHRTHKTFPVFVFLAFSSNSSGFLVKKAVRISRIPLHYLAFVPAFFSKTCLFSVKIRKTQRFLVLTAFRVPFIHKTRRKWAKIRGQNSLIPPVFSPFAQRRVKLEILRGSVRFVHQKPCNRAGFTRFEN